MNETASGSRGVLQDMMTSAIFFQATGRPPVNGSLFIHDGRLVAYRERAKLWEDLGAPVLSSESEREITLGLTGNIAVQGPLRHVAEILLRARMHAEPLVAKELMDLLERMFVEAGWIPPGAKDGLRGVADVSIQMEGDHRIASPPIEVRTKSVESVLAQAEADKQLIMIDVSEDENVREVAIIPSTKIRQLIIRQFKSADQKSEKPS